MICDVPSKCRQSKEVFKKFFSRNFIYEFPFCYSRAAHTRAIHEDGGLSVRYSPNSELVVASIGRPNCTLKVIHLKSEIPQLTASLKLFGGMCWHQRLSYVAVADDDKIKFWKVNSK